jgi:hypothetical protein
MIGENLAHQMGRDHQELHPASAVRLVLPNQLDVRFVNQSRGLERVAWPLMAKVASRESPQFGINQRHKAVQSRPVARGKLLKNESDRLRGHRNHF